MKTRIWWLTLAGMLFLAGIFIAVNPEQAVLAQSGLGPADGGHAEACSAPSGYPTVPWLLGGGAGSVVGLLLAWGWGVSNSGSMASGSGGGEGKASFHDLHISPKTPTDSAPIEIGASPGTAHKGGDSFEEKSRAHDGESDPPLNERNS